VEVNGGRGGRVYNARALVERAVSELRAERAMDAAELGCAVAAAADLVEALEHASRKLEVRTAEVPDMAAWHAWSLRLLDRGSKRGRGFLRSRR
jgi:hypothetical protein